MDRVHLKDEDDIEETGIRNAYAISARSRIEIADIKEQNTETSILNPRKRRQRERHENDSRNPKSLRITLQSSQTHLVRPDEAHGSVSKKEIEPKTSDIAIARECLTTEDGNYEQNTSHSRMADSPKASKTQEGLSSSGQGDFANMYLDKVDTIAEINVGIKSSINGVRVTSDNLVWVIYIQNHVQLFSASGSVLRSYDLDFWPSYFSCTPDGDLLVTHGDDSSPAKPTIELISREGNIRRIADLSAIVQCIWNILHQDERIYVVAQNKKLKRHRHVIIKLELNGEVEKVYEMKPNSVKIDNLISLHGQIFAMRFEKFGMLPLGTDEVSSVPVNKVHVKNACSLGASVDNFGNVIVGSGLVLSKIIVIDPRLERMHKMDFDKPQSGRIRSTAVDQQNQLWIVTDDGKLYITKYLKGGALGQQNASAI